MKTCRQASGFTLIELLVVMVISGILSAVGVASYSNFNDTQKVNQAVYDLGNNLRKAQSNAISGVKNSCCTQSQALDGWYANFSTRTYYGSCGDGAKTFPYPGKMLVPANFVIKKGNSTYTGKIYFDSITGITDLSADLTLTVWFGTEHKDITITQAGSITTL